MDRGLRSGAGDVWVNPSAGQVYPGVSSTEVLAFHSHLPGYEPTHLRDLPLLAEQLGIARLWVKEETWRIGLPSFKILGASWAIYQALLARVGDVSAAYDLEDLRSALAEVGPPTLLAATDGNHGRAVARMALMLGLTARIYVPDGTVAARIEAIESEGASVVVVDGDYDEAVRRSADDEDACSLVVSDTSWPGYEQVPTWVSEGYATIFAEVDRQLAEADGGSPATVVVPAGVGALASAALRHYRSGDKGRQTRVVTVEPQSAACVLRSLRAGQLVTVPGPHRSIMAGLNCGTPSLLAWPLLAAGVSAAVAIDDEQACWSMCRLADFGIEAGETGAAALGGLASLLGEAAPSTLHAAGLGPEASVLVLVTEGPTDPDRYEAVVGRPPRGRPGPDR